MMASYPTPQRQPSPSSHMRSHLRRGMLGNSCYPRKMTSSGQIALRRCWCAAPRPRSSLSRSRLAIRRSSTSVACWCTHDAVAVGAARALVTAGEGAGSETRAAESHDDLISGGAISQSCSRSCGYSSENEDGGANRAGAMKRRRLFFILLLCKKEEQISKII